MYDQMFKEADLTPAWVDIHFDRTLQPIVGMPKMRTMVNRGCPFMFILNCLLIDYPEIQERYPPGVLGFSLNGHPPILTDGLKDGDQIRFSVHNRSGMIH